MKRVPIPTDQRFSAKINHPFPPAILPTSPEHYFDLDVRFVEFDPPQNQDEFRRYLDQLPGDIHVN